MTFFRRSKSVLLSWLIIAFMMVPAIALAQGRDTGANGVDTDDLKIGIVTQGVGDFGAIVIRIVDFVLLIAGIVAFFYVLYGGFMYLTAGPDPANADKGRKTIFNALIGIILISISYALVTFVAQKTQDLNKDPESTSRAPQVQTIQNS